MIISSAMLFVWFLQGKQTKNPQELSFDQALTRIRNKEVSEILMKAGQIELVDKNQVKFFAKLDASNAPRETILKAADENATTVNFEEASTGWGWIVLLNALPFLLLIGFLAFTLRQMQAGGNKALSFGKSRAKLLNNQQKRVTFKDVAGVEEAKEELQEIIEFLKDPPKFQKLGGKIPKGVLMVGPPGTGKTLLAKAIAGEANVPFFSISGSDFVEMFVGVGASRVRDLFEQGKKNAPCLTGDTIVTLSGGRQVTIQEMFDRKMVGVKVPAMTEDFCLEDATVIGITRKPCTDLFEIDAAIGKIKATGNHLFPVWRGGQMKWVRVDELEEGEFLAVPRQIQTTEKTPVFYDFLPNETIVTFNGDKPKFRHPRLGEVRNEMTARHTEVYTLSRGRGGFGSSYLNRAPLYLNEDIVYLCGLLAADGCYGEKGFRSIQFVNTEPALHEKICQTLVIAGPHVGASHSGRHGAWRTVPRASWAGYRRQ